MQKRTPRTALLALLTALTATMLIAATAGAQEASAGAPADPELAELVAGGQDEPLAPVTPEEVPPAPQPPPAPGSATAGDLERTADGSGFTFTPEHLAEIKAQRARIIQGAIDWLGATPEEAAVMADDPDMAVQVPITMSAVTARNGTPGEVTFFTAPGKQLAPAVVSPQGPGIQPGIQAEVQGGPYPPNKKVCWWDGLAVSWDSVLLHLASFSQDIRACVHKKKVLPGAKAYAFGWVNSKAPWWDYLGTIEGTPKGIRFSAGHVLLYSKAKFIQEFKVYKKTYIPGIYAHIYGNGTSKWSSHK